MSFWGKKKFINNTQQSLSVILGVRKGNNPADDLTDTEFALTPKEQSMQTYGDAQNPFINLIMVSSANTMEGGHIGSTQIVLTRGSQMDNDFNTNDTITISQQNENFVLSFSNTWT